MDQSERSSMSAMECNCWSSLKRLKLVEKINKIREAYIIETDPSIKFKYEKQIAEAEQQLQEIKGQLG